MYASLLEEERKGRKQLSMKSNIHHHPWLFCLSSFVLLSNFNISVFSFSIQGEVRCLHTKTLNLKHNYIDLNIAQIHALCMNLEIPLKSHRI